MARHDTIIALAVLSFVAVAIGLVVLWPWRRHGDPSPRWRALFALRQAPPPPASPPDSDDRRHPVQLSQVSAPHATRGPASDARKAEELARFRRMHADRAAVAPLKVPVWNVIFGHRPFTVDLSDALHALTPPQFELLRQWLVQHLPVRRADEGGGEAEGGPWVEVGSVRSQGSDLSSIHVAPLFAQRHAVGTRRYNYRMRFRDGNGGEAWVRLGDEDAQRDGLQWVRHGSQVQALDNTWTVYHAPRWRNRSL